MRTECINNTVFQGQIVKTRYNFSAKPKQCLADTETFINGLIKSKPFDLYISQDYSTNEIVFETDLVGITKRIPITSKASKYIETAKNTIEEHENTEFAAKMEEWEKEQKKADLRDSILLTLSFAVLPFIFMAEEIKDGTKNFKTTFNKLAKKLATKKG